MQFRQGGFSQFVSKFVLIQVGIFNKKRTDGSGLPRALLFRRVTWLSLCFILFCTSTKIFLKCLTCTSFVLYSFYKKFPGYIQLTVLDNSL